MWTTTCRATPNTRPRTGTDAMTRELFSLAGRVALITGGNGGIRELRDA